MAAPSPKPSMVDPFGFAASLDDWCCLLRAAQEIRDADAEMMETMLEADAAQTRPPAEDDAAKLLGLATLMRSLGLDPEAIRRREPEVMRALEAVCLTCEERPRCLRELQARTAPRTYETFCPNAPRITRLRRV